MPAAQTILDATRQLANDWLSIALGWHVLFSIAALVLLMGWRPRRRQLAALTLLPFLSVMILAWRSGNAFTALVFLAAATALIAVAARFGDEPAARGQRADVVIGALLIGLGWAYPHFLDGGSWTRYLYEAPLGVVPCATLSFAAGVSIASGGFQSHGWSLIMAAITGYYGVIGVFVLGVPIDAALVAAALILAARARHFHAEDSATPRGFSHEIPDSRAGTA